jgi:ATP-binding cassette subfamily F protein 3
MIQLTGAGKRYGPKILFENTDWLVTPNERTGIVGANGTGKSSMLKVLAGIEGLDSGTITTQKGTSVGYLPQDGLSLSGRTVFAECMTVFDDLRALEDEQEQLAHRMSELDHNSAEYSQVAERFQRAESEFRARDGYSIEAQVGAVLSGLGFSQRDWKRRTEEFSGGWQMRIALAKLLLEAPNLLLLDEPTNHLDIEARNWLEGYLSSYPNAFVLISHDRYFLDVTVRKIAELWNKRIHFYTGGFTKYEVQKTERRAQLQAAYANQKDRIEQLEAFINRFRAQATKAKQVQSRIKELDRIERIEIPPEEKTIHFKFPQPKASGRVVAEFKNVAKSYGDHPVFSDVNFIIERGERIALVGVNGAGKSTLIKILSGAYDATEGEILVRGEPQHFSGPADASAAGIATVYQDLALVDMRDVAANLFLGREFHKGPFVDRRRIYREAERILAGLTIKLPSVRVPVYQLSGGQRQAVAIARVLVGGAEVIIMDEPTAALGVQESERVLRLVSDLRDQGKAVILISHNLQQVWDVADRVMVLHLGRVAGIRVKSQSTVDEIVKLIVYGSDEPAQGVAA